MNLYKTLKNADISLQEIKYYSRNDLRYNSINNSIYFKTCSLELFNPFADMFLSKKK